MVEVAGVEPASKKREVEVHPQAWSVLRSLCREIGQPWSRIHPLFSIAVRGCRGNLSRSDLRQTEVTRWLVLRARYQEITGTRSSAG